MLTNRHRPLVLGITLCLGLLCFALGAWSSQLRVEQRIAENDARIAELRDQMVRNVLETRRARMPRRLGTSGEPIPDGVATDAESRDALVGEIKRQLQSEMGLLPIRVLRERRTSFVEVHAYDQSGRMGYATAGYLGNGAFITVKHAVVALGVGIRNGRSPPSRLCTTASQCPRE